MTDREYAELVGRMRAAQKEYFKFKAERNMVRAMGLEREVDAETARRLAPPEHPTLFDRMPAPEDTL